MGNERYIWIRNWERFQHYKDRQPTWIKTYVELLHDDAYLSLTEHQALLLHRLWLTFASARSHLLLTTSSLSRHTHLRVMRRDIEALNRAGFIDIIASKTLARRKQSAMPDTETDKEKELTSTSVSETTHVRASDNGSLDFHSELLLTRLLAWIGSDGDERTPAVVRHALSKATEHAKHELGASLATARPRHRAKYVVGTLKAATARGKEKP